MENIFPVQDGVQIKHLRAKQRSDKRETAFKINYGAGSQIDYASFVVEYLNQIKSDINKVSGTVFWTVRGRNFINQPMGRNYVSNVGHEIASFLKLENPKAYTFHSFRRASATQAADMGATPQQLVDFYGWKSTAMAQEYISTSKFALQNMATRLAGNTLTTHLISKQTNVL